MLTMQKYLALIALPAAALCHAQASPPTAPVPAAEGFQQVAVQKPEPVSTTVPARQLSPEQKAELRRQLSEYRRLPGKGS